MFFNSVEFAIFLPLIFILYWFVFYGNLKLQNTFIVVASYIFYGWWDWRFLLLMAFTTLCSWYSGILIHKLQENSIKGELTKKSFVNAKGISVINIVINLAILGLFKYYNFFVESFVDAFQLFGRELSVHSLKIILPVGISFYTFQALSYSIDVYKQKLQPTKEIISFFAYVSFFPQLVAGPIERATRLLPQFKKRRVFEYGKAVDGMRQILWGLFKKVVVADTCAIYVNQVFDNYHIYDGSTLFLAAVLFAFQIYGDFSGYSDIAIGTAKLFGFELMQNFNFPYFSRDIAEFWRRWHISLTTWFRDYVYIPLGGSRVSKSKVIRNTFIIFLVSGFWHGANWTFIAWGAFHAILFLPLIISERNRKNITIIAKNKSFPSLIEILQVLTTFFLVAVSWIFFRADTIKIAFNYIIEMFSENLLSVPMLKNRSYYLPLFISVCVLFILEWFNRNKKHGLDLSTIKSHAIKFCIYFILISMIFWLGGNPEIFIYFQF